MNIRSILKLTFALFAFAMIFASCEDITLAELEQTNSGEKVKSNVQIITRSAEADAPLYPLHIYAFNTEGVLVAQQHIASDSEELFLSLPQQTECKLVAVSADEQIYNLPTNPTASSQITLKSPVLGKDATDFARSIAQHYASSHPLQIGATTIYPTSEHVKTVIQLHYQVVSLSISLKGLPSECTNAYVSVTSPSQSVSLDAASSGTATSRIPLSLTATSLWTAKVYLFPTSGTTTFTIAYTDKQGEHTASVSYLSPLVPGTPYFLNGNYDDGNIHLSGSISSSTWNDPVSLDFNFADGSSTSIGNSTNPEVSDEDVIVVNQVPQSMSLWNGHIVIAILDEEGNHIESSTASSGTMLLLSFCDWDNMTSAINTASPTEAFSIANGYGETDLSKGWRIPTTDEAKILTANYLADPNVFDALLQEAGADPVVLTDQKGSNLRYLCQDAQKTFSFKNTTISNAGATVKNYHLRLVRTVKVKKENSEYI